MERLGHTPAKQRSDLPGLLSTAQISGTRLAEMLEQRSAKAVKVAVLLARLGQPAYLEELLARVQETLEAGKRLVRGLDQGERGKAA